MFVEKRTEKIERPLVELPIEFLNLEELKPHEALVQQELEAFKRSVRDLGIFYMPALITSENYIIIDGHHRWAGLKELGAKRIPCILLDYISNDSIKLDSWYPIVKGNANIILDLLDTNFSMKVIEFNSREDLIEKIKKSKGDEFGLITQSGENYLVIADFQFIIDVLQKNQKLELGYIDTVKSALIEVNNKTIDFTLIRKPVTKEEVVAKVKSGGVFAPKTTRHILPFRYQDIKVKLEDLF